MWIKIFIHSHQKTKKNAFVLKGEKNKSTVEEIMHKPKEKAVSFKNLYLMKELGAPYTLSSRVVILP